MVAGESRSIDPPPRAPHGAGPVPAIDQDQVDAAVTAAVAARERGDFDAADAILADALRRSPQQHRLLHEYGWVAFYRGDMLETARRWLTVALLFDGGSGGWLGLSRALTRLGKIEFAEVILEFAGARLPDDRDIMIGKAELASARQQWSKALAMWRSLKPREQGSDRFDGRIGEAVWHLQFDEASHAPGARRVEIEAVDDPIAREFFKKFESLGENCEFGLVQRRYGAEPLGLLRWNTTPPDMLLKMLDARFEGLGDPGATTIAADSSGEYYIGDATYRLHLHTFIAQHQADAREVLAKQRQRIVRLRQMMIDRLTDGGKLFVYKTAEPNWRDIVGRIYAALRRYGRNGLLTVHLADAGNPPGTVRRSQPGLFHGYLDRMQPMRPGEPAIRWDISFDAWLDVCVAAHRLHEQDLAVAKPAGPNDSYCWYA